jgi:hypothetical protein
MSTSTANPISPDPEAPVDEPDQPNPPQDPVTEPDVEGPDDPS